MEKEEELLDQKLIFGILLGRGAGMLVLNPHDDWRRALERDGMFVATTSMEESFVLRKATDSDWLVAIVSALEDSGKLKWTESSPTKAPFYTTTLPDTDWVVSIKPTPGEMGHYVELHKKDGRGFAIINQPSDGIDALYHRVYKGHGHLVLRMDGLQNPEIRQHHEAKQRLISDALKALKGAG